MAKGRSASASEESRRAISAVETELTDNLFAAPADHDNENEEPASSMAADRGFEIWYFFRFR